MKTDGRRDEFMARVCTSVWSAARKLDVLGGIFTLYKSASFGLCVVFSVLTALWTDVREFSGRTYRISGRSTMFYSVR